MNYLLKINDSFYCFRDADSSMLFTLTPSASVSWPYGSHWILNCIYNGLKVNVSAFLVTENCPDCDIETLCQTMDDVLARSNSMIDRMICAN